MYYKTPNVDTYVANVIKYRIPVLVSFLTFFLFIFFTYQPKIISSDEMFWLKHSKEFKKTLDKNYETFSLSKLQITVDDFNPSSQEKLHTVHTVLSGLKEVEQVSSLFSEKLIHETKQGDSSMVGVISIDSLQNYKIKNLINESEHHNSNFVDNDFHTFNFYILSKKALDLSQINIPFKYKYKTLSHSINTQYYLLFSLLLIIIVITVFRVLFSNYISSFIAFFVISLTGIITFYIINLLTGIQEIYVAMPLISMSIALVDYLFFYYRWHVSQYKTDTNDALVKMLNRNLSPAFWTSLLTTLGLGSLVFISSDIVKVLSLSVIVSSLVAYSINLSFLPAILSFFQLKHARVPFNKVCSLFASSEVHYSKKSLVLFLTITFTLMSLGAYKIYEKNNHFFHMNLSDEQIVINIPYEKIDLSFIHTLENFSTDLENEFPDSIDTISKSLATVVNNLNEANSQTSILDEQALEQALFYMDLYGLSEDYYNKDYVKIMIVAEDIDKHQFIQWLVNYKDLDIYFIDKGSLLNSAMYEKTVLLSISLLSALFIIGLITGWIFRSFSMIFVGILINSLPIVWFGFFVKLLGIPLSIEMLISMTISLGLASDATIHFAFKYFRSRYFGRTTKHSLEKMFFYSGIPVIFGSLILITIFFLLGISNIEFLKSIGFYSATLILLSLLSDLFILPIILLFLDKFNVQGTRTVRKHNPYLD